MAVMCYSGFWFKHLTEVISKPIWLETLPNNSAEQLGQFVCEHISVRTGVFPLKSYANWNELEGKLALKGHYIKFV